MSESGFLRTMPGMKRHTTTFDLFARNVLPERMSEHARNQFLVLGKSRKLAPDRPQPLDVSDRSLVFVGGGAVKLVAHASGEREQIIAFYFPDDFFILPENGAHSFSLHGLSRSELLIFPYDRFTALAQDECEILRYLLNRSALSLQRSREKTVALGRKTALERIAGFLLAMAERVGIRRGTQVDIDLPMSRRDIADSLGLTIETVSRQISILRSQGLIETHGRSGIVIRSREALERCSGSLRRAA